MVTTEITLVAAVGKNGAIGVDGDLPWHLPDDLAHFKKLTHGGAVVMGRKTWESIGRALPGRLSVVVTRDTEYHIDQPQTSATNVAVAHSVDEALGVAKASRRPVFVIGGAQIYQSVLDLVTCLVITHVDQSPPADAYFPTIDHDIWEATHRQTGHGFQIVTYRRVPGA